MSKLETAYIELDEWMRPHFNPGLAYCMGWNHHPNPDTGGILINFLTWVDGKLVINTGKEIYHGRGFHLYRQIFDIIPFVREPYKIFQVAYKKEDILDSPPFEISVKSVRLLKGIRWTVLKSIYEEYWEKRRLLCVECEADPSDVNADGYPLNTEFWTKVDPLTVEYEAKMEQYFGIKSGGSK